MQSASGSRTSAGGRVRRIVLMRHAKSAYPSGVPDHDRPLAGKGLRNAQAAGGWFRAEGPAPDLVLCSDAVRARQTWEVVAGSLAASPRLRTEAALYDSGPGEVIELLRSVGTRPATVVVVGHEPTMSATGLLLAGPGSDPAALSRMSVKFPTTGIAVLRLDGPWHRLEPGAAALETFDVPRA